MVNQVFDLGLVFAAGGGGDAVHGLGVFGGEVVVSFSFGGEWF